MTEKSEEITFSQDGIVNLKILLKEECIFELPVSSKPNLDFHQRKPLRAKNDCSRPPTTLLHCELPLRVRRKTNQRVSSPQSNL